MAVGDEVPSLSFVGLASPVSSVISPVSNGACPIRNSLGHSVLARQRWHMSANGSQDYRNLSSRGSYSRNYSLVADKAPPPPKKLAVVRDAPVRVRLPGWNDHRAPVEMPSREKLPSIRRKTSCKYTYLHEGKSVTSARKQSDLELYIIHHTTGHRKVNDHTAVLSTQDVVNVVAALRRVAESGAREDWESGRGGSESVKYAKSVFGALSDASESITAENLYSYLHAATKGGVAVYETYDFLAESCGRKSLFFEDFLLHVDKLCERILAYEKFSALSMESKINAIARRVLQNPLQWEESKRLQRLMRCANEQASGYTLRNFSSLRIYELRFLFELQQKWNVGCTYQSGNNKEWRPQSSLRSSPRFHRGRENRLVPLECVSPRGSCRSRSGGSSRMCSSGSRGRHYLHLETPDVGLFEVFSGRLVNGKDRLRTPVVKDKSTRLGRPHSALESPVGLCMNHIGGHYSSSREGSGRKDVHAMSSTLYGNRYFEDDEFLRELKRIYNLR
ncbi:hypothetical protein TRVL_02853 [Trypanosoma vivax]|nr:hypothetical protein TRVL_02853 [Trypanosoma vivax]